MISTSGSTEIATANATRISMPVEYVFTGCSMNVPMSAKRAISANFPSISVCVMPRIDPAR